MKKYTILLLCLMSLSWSYAQEANYDEAKVPQYTLPDPLRMESGGAVQSEQDWIDKRRSEILNLFETHVYGRSPANYPKLNYKILTEDRTVFNHTATRREVAIYFDKDKEQYMTVLMYIPNKKQGKVPLFWGLNFKGNHAVHSDPGITKSIIREEKPVDFDRGAESSRWPVEMLLENGYALATVYRGDIDPDFDDGFQNGVQPLFYEDGQTRPEKDEWGTIAAWAWGLGYAMNYFEVDKDIDAQKVAVIGHSRHGKAALWAGAIDQRFAMVISNDSGCGGAAISRRCFGETVSIINNAFPHWFCDNFKQYNNRENALPIDQHQLIALIAPRPVYIASAVDDRWADPKGEFLSGVYATPVYNLFGLQGLLSDTMPAVDSPVMDGYVGYHIRTGGHDINLYDWQQYVKFADKHLKNK